MVITMRDEGGKAHGHLREPHVARRPIFARLRIMLPLVLLASIKAPLSKVYRFWVVIKLIGLVFHFGIW
jgi:hypothetical protein